MFPETVTPSLSEAVLLQAAKLTPEERLELFLQYVGKANALWTLAGESGFIMLEPEDESSEDNIGALLPIWPHQDLIGLWSRAQETGASPTSIDLEDFINTWLPGLATNDVALVVCPVGEDQTGMVLSANELLQSLTEEAR
ncbi:DUF2750 domain-containing protein [Salinimonas sediminis]|uniref:DUF2750 domain-containing protein n=1 Tax=Salinimonas sediminis TaxID=2303538 RepID=A0A346NL23_9ALTE|nr:DUF2750 domain-containing protein [Salinimonas sediminis]AXR06230.1 DUF2750 domain-containing protein [Salinimonas sediminis]